MATRRTLGEEIRHQRGDLSVRALHRECGVAFGYLSRLENGEQKAPGPQVLARIAKAAPGGDYGALMRAAGYL